MLATLSLLLAGAIRLERPTVTDPPLPAHVRLVWVRELESVDVKVIDSSDGSLDVLNDQHVLEFKYKLFRIDHTSGAPSNLKNRVWVGMKGCAVAASSSATQAMGSSGNYWVGGSLSDDEDTSKFVTLYKVFPTSPSYPLTIDTVGETTVYGDSGGGNWTATTTTADPKFSLSRVTCSDASIDSRKAYGVANENGETTPDGNWDSQNVNFGSYMYRGGLFVGNMPPPGSGAVSGIDYIDWSGSARLQLWTASNSDPGTMLYANVTVLDMGGPVVPTGVGTTGIAPVPDWAAYIPDNDTNSSTTESTATWDKKWVISDTGSGSGNGGNGQAGTGPKPPITDGQTIPSDDVGGLFLNFPITYVDESATTGTFYFTATNLSRIVIAIRNEQSNLDDISWRYFASKDWQNEYGSGQSFPFNDAAPRMWLTRIDGGHSGHW